MKYSKIKQLILINLLKLKKKDLIHKNTNPIFSIITTFNPDSAALIAANNPEAPAPIIIISKVFSFKSNFYLKKNEQFF